MSLELAELTLDNDSFAQELTNTFESNNDFERPPIRNSRRKKSKTIARANKRIKRAQRNVKKGNSVISKPLETIDTILVLPQ